MRKDELYRAYTRATTICQKPQDCSDEIDILRHDLQLSAYPTELIESVINRSKTNVRLKREVQPVGFISILLPVFQVQVLKWTGNSGSNPEWASFGSK
jgi:hypothetical protein